MVPSRNGPKGAEIASFGLAILVYVLTPTQVGHQDLAAPAAQQPAVTTRWREPLIASPVRPYHGRLRLPRPIGPIPEPPLVACSLTVTSDGSDRLVSTRMRAATTVVFPTINAPAKATGWCLAPSGSSEELHVRSRSSRSNIIPARAKTGELDNDHTDNELPDAQTVVLADIARDALRHNAAVVKPDEIAAAMHSEPFPEYDISLSLELDPKISMEDPADLADLDPTEFTPNAPPSLEGLNAEVKETRLYFGNDLFGSTLGDMKPWAIGEEPVLMTPRAPADPDMKQTAPIPATAVPGVTVAGKGEVTGEDRRPKTPAERLGLAGPKRVKAEKCLANAVYFEARSEPVRGQIAVAQVVMNRAFSGFYRTPFAAVVSQNGTASRLPVTFACDASRCVTTRTSWRVRQRIARETLDGKLCFRKSRSRRTIMRPT